VTFRAPQPLTESHLPIPLLSAQGQSFGEHVGWIATDAAAAAAAVEPAVAAVLEQPVERIVGSATA
jgi:hypothetical protein